MGKRLSERDIERFHAEGFLSPIRVMSAADAQRLRVALEDVEAGQGGPLRGAERHKAHLLYKFLSDVVHHDAILDCIEDLYGPDLLCWSTNFFIKEKTSPAFVSWHQDSTYWGLVSAADDAGATRGPGTLPVVTVWLAITPSSAANGAMEVIPGTHLADQVPHRDTFDANNLLTRGQEIAVDVDASRAVRLDLQPGEMSLHHVRLVHGSPPNPSDDRRIGFAIRYIPTSVAQRHGEDSATLVRGVDRYRHFAPEPVPSRDREPALVEFHRRFTEKSAQILYRGTGIRSYDDPAARATFR